MPKFEYIARDKKGERITGVIEVDDRQAVVGRLQTMGYFPIRINDTTPSGSKRRNLAHLRGRVATSQMVDFQRQLADLMQAGVPLVKSLNIIVNQTQDELLREIVTDISKNVQGGDTLARAMSRHPKTFNTITVAMVRAGEMGGMLPDILERLADFAETESELKSKVISSLTYPIIMVLAGIVVIAILLIVVIPKITSVYSNMGQELPLITRMLISLTNTIASYWWLILLGIIAVVFLFQKFIETREGKLLWHRFLLKLPVLGRVIHLRQLALFSRTFGNLLRNGVPILQALEITERVIGNAVLLREIHKLSPAISQGEAMASVMRHSSLFPETMTSMVSVGEETAQVDDILVRISDSYERQVSRMLKTLTAAMEPMIILVLGIVVGFVVIAMLLPIMSLDPTGEF